MASKQRERKIATIRTIGASRSRGSIGYGTLAFACAIGRSGRRVLKREGDGASPVGIWPIRLVLYRADKMIRPETALPVRAIRPADAWCDVAGDRNYNRLVRLPYATLHERLWRDDQLYDICVVLGHNDRPRVQGLGSAIFMHVARQGYTPTEGCVALGLGDLRHLLAVLPTGSAVRF